MDLHLVYNGGDYLSDRDCYYGNCVTNTEWLPLVNWGNPSSTLDDPRLDLDDIPGTGPENINIAEPAAGTYVVSVHDYPGTVLYEPNRVTVQVYLDGERVYLDSKVVNGEDIYVPFVAIQ